MHPRCIFGACINRDGLRSRATIAVVRNFVFGCGAQKIDFVGFYGVTSASSDICTAGCTGLYSGQTSYSSAIFFKFPILQ